MQSTAWRDDLAVPDATRPGATPSRERPAAARAGKVLVTTSVPDQKTAWTKARKDVAQILAEEGYAQLQLPAGASPLAWMRFADALQAVLGEGGHVLIEYPFDQRKRAWLLQLLARRRGGRIHALLHDLDSLRHDDSPPQRELAVLQLFDGLVSHNPAMTEWLRAQGLGMRVANLNLFDYCAPGRPDWAERDLASPLRVVCAGNLSYPKARFIYDPRLGELQGVELSLFGAFFEPERMPESPVQYRGVFDPDAPALDRRYHYGLIWDGESVETCSGNYGRYMRWNNPHKLSLYMALGLPVIVWREAAIARFVLGRGVGVVVDDLRDIGRVAGGVGSAEYRQLAANAARLGGRARRGEFLREALGHLLRDRPD